MPYSVNHKLPIPPQAKTILIGSKDDKQIPLLRRQKCIASISPITKALRSKGGWEISVWCNRTWEIMITDGGALKEIDTLIYTAKFTGKNGSHFYCMLNLEMAFAQEMCELYVSNTSNFSWRQFVGWSA